MMENDKRANLCSYILLSDRPNESHEGELNRHFYIREGENDFRSVLVGDDYV
jgi:hypothetical protein